MLRTRDTKDKDVRDRTRDENAPEPWDLRTVAEEVHPRDLQASSRFNNVILSFRATVLHIPSRPCFRDSTNRHVETLERDREGLLGATIQASYKDRLQRIDNSGL